ncbi:putative BRCT domain-containing protein [Dioscorea sansibarensis]
MKISSFSSSKTGKNHEESTEAVRGSKIIFLDVDSSSSCLISSAPNTGQVDTDRIIKSSRWMEIYADNEEKSIADILRQRNFPNEVSSLVKKKSTDNIMCNSDHEVAVVGYNLSQEPGVLSQAKAFDAVDNFLFDNDLASTQEIGSGKSKLSKSPCVSISKGVQYLARWVDHQSLVAQTPIFDWAESIDDEKGELFNGTKGSSSERRVDALNLHSQVNKQRDCSSAVTGAAVAMDGDEDAKVHLINVKMQSFSGLNSGTKFNNSLPENLLGSKNETIQSDAYDHSNSKILQQHLKDTDAYEGIYDVGPSTQLAAEAMEALCYSPSLNHEMKKDMHQTNDLSPGDSSTDMTVGRNLGDTLFHQRVSSAHDLRVITKQSNRGKMECNIFSRGRPHAFRKQSIKSRMEKVLENTTGETPARNIFSHSVLPGTVKMQERESKANSPTEVSFNHPKRRRTNHITHQNHIVVDNFERPSLSTIMHFSSEQGGIKAIVKGFPHIFATVKRKKRSIRGYLSAQNNNILFNIKEQPLLSGFGQKSLMRPLSSKSLSERNLENFFTKSTFEGGDMIENPQTGKPLKRKDQFLGMGCRLSWIEAGKLLPFYKANDQEISQDKDSITKDLRRRKYMADVRVMFSQHLDSNTLKRQKKILARLALTTASSIFDATHFVAEKFARTRNMLEAMALGRPVVTHMWLESCGQANCLINEKNYIVRDLKKEKQFCFCMPVSLAHACQNPLLKGRRVFVTPNTKPDRELLLSLVKASSGEAMEMTEISAINDDKILEILIISCEEDHAICQPLLDKGAKVYDSELLLTGIVIQKLECERHVLFTNHAEDF